MFELKEAFRNFPKKNYKSSSNHLNAAVSLIFLGHNFFESKFLIIRRSEREDDPWSGHMALPGGIYEDGDQDYFFTAIRETKEEVGIVLGQDSFVGEMSYYKPSKSPGKKELIIHPYVFSLKDRPKINLCPLEVANSYWIPFKYLYDENNFCNKSFKFGEEDYFLPTFQFSHEGELLVVWGVTYVILVEFLLTLANFNLPSSVMDTEYDLECLKLKWELAPYK